MRHFCIALLAVSAWMPIASAQENDSEIVPNPKDKILSRELEHGSAESMIVVLNELFPVKFTTDQSANTIYARVPEDQIDEINQIIDQMESSTAEAEAKRKNTNGFGSSLTGPKASAGALGAVARMQRARSERNSGNGKGLQSPVRDLEAIAPMIVKDLNLDLTWLERDLIPLVKQLCEVELEFGPEHPNAVQLKNQIDSVREQVLNSLDSHRKHLMDSRPSTDFATKHAELETEVSKFIEQLREENAQDLPADETAKIKASLTESVGKLFDVRQQAEEADWEKFNEQLSKIRQRLDERNANRDEIIARRVEALLKQDSTETPK